MDSNGGLFRKTGTIHIYETKEVVLHEPSDLEYEPATKYIYIHNPLLWEVVKVICKMLIELCNVCIALLSLLLCLNLNSRPPLNQARWWGSYPNADLIMQGMRSEVEPIWAHLTTSVTLPRIIDIVKPHVQLVQGSIPKNQLAVSTRVNLVPFSC